MTQLVITPRPFQYMLNQRGDLQHLKDNPAAWNEAYHAELERTLYQIGHFCTTRPMNMLDIGCGIGSVPCMMMKEFGTQAVLVDGEDGSGVADKHAVPFGSRKVVVEFMADNGVHPDLWQYRNPEQLVDRELPVFDLVISLRSWCFHYPPEVYLWLVQKHVTKGTCILLDVRKNSRYAPILKNLWRDNYIIDSAEKHDRMMFVVGGRTQ